MISDAQVDEILFELNKIRKELGEEIEQNNFSDDVYQRE